MGGKNASDIAIFEGGSAQTLPDKLLDNCFITNKLDKLYRDFVIGATNDINAVNDPLFSGATAASGNFVTND